MPDSLKEKLRDGLLDWMGSTCSDTSDLVSESMDHRVSIIKLARINFHLAICKFCRDYKTQLETIRGLARGLEKEVTEAEDSPCLKPDAKEKLKRLIRGK